MEGWRVPIPPLPPSIPKPTMVVTSSSSTSSNVVEVVSKKVSLGSKGRLTVKISLELEKGNFGPVCFNVNEEPEHSSNQSNSTSVNLLETLAKDLWNLFKKKGGSETKTAALELSAKALGNPMIMQNVIKYLPKNDLIPFRKVSKTWNTLMTSEFKKHQLPLELTDKNIYQYLSIISSSQEVPYSKYHLNDISADRKCIETLFNFYGSLITYLKLTLQSQVTQLTASQFKHMLNNLPELSELIIYDTFAEFIGNRRTRFASTFLQRSTATQPCWVEWKTTDDENGDPFSSLPILPKLIQIGLGFSQIEDNEQSRGFMTDLFNSAINLQVLKIFNTSLSSPSSDNWDDESDESTSGHHTVLIGLKNKISGLTQLKTLHLDSLTSSKELAILVDLTQHHGLALTNLSIINLGSFEVSDDDTHKRILEEFLNLQATELKNLSIGIQHKSSDAAFHVPIMPNLEKFELDYFYDGMSLTFDHSLIEHFPKLTKFNVSNIKDGAWRINDESNEKLVGWVRLFGSSGGLNGAIIPHVGIKELIIDFGIRSPEQLEQLASLFPNLISLDITLESLGLMTHIWDKWPQLESLCITKSTRKKAYVPGHDTFNVLANEVITGIPAELHSTIDMILGLSPLEVLNQLKSMPGISDLKKLRKLELHFLTCPFGFTDISVYYGLVLPDSKLQSITISKADKISLKCRKYIKKVLGPKAVIDIAYADAPYFEGLDPYAQDDSDDSDEWDGWN